MPSPTRMTPPHMAPKGICPTVRAHSMTGSVSGSASPLTHYGSFPPSDSPASTQDRTHNVEEIEERLKASLRSDSKGGRGLRRTKRRGRTLNRSWSKSTEVLDDGHGIFEDNDPDDGDESGDDGLLRAPGSNARRQRSRSRSQEPETHWGVRKMEMMGTSWSRRTLMTLYAGVYLISSLTSLEGNTTPTVEPYYVSYLGSHSSLSTLVIVVSVAFAVGKPPFAKVLDVFGRAEGIAFAAGIFAISYLMAACATSIPMFLVAKALAALGAQGIQLAQQIIVADTTTLTNRGLITSTISLPWLVTTWLGPPLGAFFQSLGPTGYRVAYALFGILLPIVSGMLVVTLFAQWRRTKRLDARLLHPEMVEIASKAEMQPHVTLTNKARAVWRELDIVGLVTLTAGCICLLVPFTIAQQRPAAFHDLSIWLMIAFGLLTLTFFWKYESSIAKLPLLPSRLLGNKTILCGSALGFFHFASQFCYESFFTSFLQVARGHSPRDASYISQSYIFAASISAIAAGFGAKWSRRYKWIGIAGTLTHMAGTCLMLRTRNLDSSTFELVLSQLVGGVGGGFTTIAAQIGCQSVVSHQDVGIATAIFLTLTQIGGAVGGAVAGFVWSSLLPRRLSSRLPAEDTTLIPQIMSSLPFAMSFTKGTPTRDAIDASYVDVQRVLNAIAIALLGPALFAVCAMKNIHLGRDDQDGTASDVQGVRGSRKAKGVVVLGRASRLGLSEGDDDDEGMLTTDSETSSLLREHVA